MGSAISQFFFHQDLPYYLKIRRILQNNYFIQSYAQQI